MIKKRSGHLSDVIHDTKINLTGPPSCHCCWITKSPGIDIAIRVSKPLTIQMGVEAESLPDWESVRIVRVRGSSIRRICSMLAIVVGRGEVKHCRRLINSPVPLLIRISGAIALLTLLLDRSKSICHLYDKSWGKDGGPGQPQSTAPFHPAQVQDGRCDKRRGSS